MRRLELSDEEHAKLLDALGRQCRATGDPELRELALHVAHCPRVVAYVYSVPIPAAQKSGGEAEAPPPPARHVTVGAPEGAEGPPPLGAAASR